MRLTLAIAVGLLVSRLPAAFAQGAPESCCIVVANPELRRLGRIVVTYPVDVTSARLDIFRAGQAQSVASGYGDQAIDLLPGKYDVAISGARVADVAVQSGHNTEIRVGVLRMQASSGTRFDVVEPGTGKALTSGYGNGVIGLPVGQVEVRISGQAETVVIEAGQVIDF